MKTKNIFWIGAVSLVTKFLFVFFISYGITAKAAPAPESFADLAEKLLPTVVNISSTQKVDQQVQVNPFQTSPFQNQFPEGHPFHDFFNDFMGQQFQMLPQQRPQDVSSLGSGFIVDKQNGIVITNNHVIDGADEIKITLFNDKVIPATVVGVDDKTDIAVLKADLKDENVSDATFGDSDAMRVGDWVIAIGNPFGLGGTVTAGIISARQRDIHSGPYDDYIQTDASINRGNSGGPMFNIKGEVIGINTAIFSPTGGSVGIGFAIPSVLAEPVIDQINEFGRTRRGWLGVKIQDVTDEIADSLGLKKAAGALVAEVTPTGPAEKAGIETGDVILAFDNKPVREMRHLPRLVAETDINKDVTIIVWRDGKRVTLTANIGELEKAEDDGLLAAHDGENILEDDGMDNPNGVAIDKLGLRLGGITPETRQLFSLPKTVSGLVVMDVDANADAAKKGIAAGDVIVTINQKPVTSIQMVEGELDSTQKSGRDTVLLLVNRNGSIQFVAVKLNDNTDTSDKNDDGE